MSYPNLSEAGMLAQELAQRLAGIGSALTVVQSFGSSNDPLITVGTSGAGNQNALIRLTTRPSLFLNAVGNTQEVYAPQLAQIAVEASTIANVELLTIDNQVIVFGTVLKYGNETQFWLVTNGNAVIESAFAGTNATLKATFNLSLKYGNQASI